MHLHGDPARAAGRRELLGSLALACALAPAAALLGPCASSQASSLGDSVRGILLRAQRQNGGAKLLAPFEASKMRLQEAMTTLDASPSPTAAAFTGISSSMSSASSSSGSGSQEALLAYNAATTAGDEGTAATAATASSAAVLSALQAVRASSLNCYVFEALPGDDNEVRASLLTQQMKLADPCTFRLVVKNVVDFSPEEVKAQGKDLLNNVIRSYALLDDSLVNAMQEGTSSQDMADVRRHLQATYAAVASLETFVEQALQVV